jgi:hypothetical protein
MASEKLSHEKYWVWMERATSVVDSWPDWEKGTPQNVRSVDAAGQPSVAISSPTGSTLKLELIPRPVPSA